MIFNEEKSGIKDYDILINSQSDLNNINTQDLVPGTKVHCISNNKGYILTGNKDWYEYKETSEAIFPEGTFNINKNGNYSVMNFATASVNVQPNNQYLNINNSGVYETGLNYCGVNVNIAPADVYLNINNSGVYETGLNYRGVNVNIAPEDVYLNINSVGTYETGLNYRGVNVNIPTISTRFNTETNTLYIRDDGQIA